MATIMQMRWKDVTAEQYEQVCSRVDWDSLPERGAIAHAAGIDEDGRLNIVDVWESAQHFQRFAEEVILPAVAEVGIEEQPEITLSETIRGWSRQTAAAT